MLYVTLAPDFQGTIVLPYRVTDGKLFSTPADATHRRCEVRSRLGQGRRAATSIRRSTPAIRAASTTATLLGAPGSDPTLPSSVDLSEGLSAPRRSGKPEQLRGLGAGLRDQDLSGARRASAGRWKRRSIVQSRVHLQPVQRRAGPRLIYRGRARLRRQRRRRDARAHALRRRRLPDASRAAAARQEAAQLQGTELGGRPTACWRSRTRSPTTCRCSWSSRSSTTSTACAARIPSTTPSAAPSKAAMRSPPSATTTTATAAPSRS